MSVRTLTNISESELFKNMTFNMCIMTDYNKLEEKSDRILQPRRLFEDTGRDEEPWDTPTEDLIKEWRESCSSLCRGT